MTLENKEAIIKLVYNKAYEYEPKYHGWSQVTVLALQEVFAMKDEVERRVMQLEIEQEALKKEKDAASKKRLTNMEKELADL